MPGGAASIGFHLLHLAGSTDRLFTTARGGTFSDAQRKALADERSIPDPPPALTELLAAWGHVVQQCLEHLLQVIDARLDESSLVGRAQLPSTVRGPLFHAAEHA